MASRREQVFRWEGRGSFSKEATCKLGLDESAGIHQIRTRKDGLRKEVGTPKTLGEAGVAGV